MFVRTLLAAVCLQLGAAAAQTLETYQQRQQDLAGLSEIFGELHHIRRTCEPRYEGDVWRERMKKLIELEEPQQAEREAMVQGFNNGYRGAQQRFPDCDRRARDYAAGRAAEGDAIVARLTATLQQPQDGGAAAPFLPARPRD